MRLLLILTAQFESSELCATSLWKTWALSHMWTPFLSTAAGSRSMYWCAPLNQTLSASSLRYFSVSASYTSPSIAPEPLSLFISHHNLRRWDNERSLIDLGFLLEMEPPTPLNTKDNSKLARQVSQQCLSGPAIRAISINDI